MKWMTLAALGTSLAWGITNAQSLGDQTVVDTVSADSPRPAPPQTEDPSARAGTGIAEIIVTAQKREQKLQDVPISIQAFTGDTLSARGIDSTAALSQTVSGLNFTSVAGFSLVTLRGMGTDIFIPSADQSVATYVDGIYIPNLGSSVNALGDAQRIEVLKGPQGTLFGRNSTAGAISITTQDPGNTFKAFVEGSTGNYALRAASAGVNLPLTEWLALGVYATTSYQHDYNKDIFYDIQPTKLDAARVKAHVQITDDLALSLTNYLSKQSAAGSDVSENVKPSLLGTAAGIRADKADHVSESDYPVAASARQRLTYANLTWGLAPFDVKLLGSTQYNTSGPVSLDFDSSRLPLVAFDNQSYTDFQTGELQILSNRDSWLSDRLEWIVGGYFLQSRIGFDPVHFYAAPNLLGAAIDLLNLSLPSGSPEIALPDALSDLFAGAPLENLPGGNQGVALMLRGVMSTTSRSAYAQVTWHIDPTFDLTLGGRLQREHRGIKKAETNYVNPLNQAPIRVLTFEHPSATARNFSPKAVLSAKLTDRSMVYASYAVGFKSGTYNIISIYTPPNYIVPEEVRTGEIGAKTDLLDGLLRLNGAIFYNDIRNLQTGFVSLLAGGAIRFESAPKARTRGAEIEATWIPLPTLDQGLTLTANASYIDSEYVKYPDGEGFAPGTGIYANNLDYSGNRFSRVPKWTAMLGFSQEAAVPGGMVEFGMDVYYNAGFFFDAGNTDREPHYETLDARLSYTYQPWDLRLTLFGRNLLDETYRIQAFQTDFGTNVTLAAPRMFGLRLRCDF